MLEQDTIELNFKRCFELGQWIAASPKMEQAWFVTRREVTTGCGKSRRIRNGQRFA